MNTYAFWCIILKVELGESFEIKKHNTVIIKNTDLKIYFKGAGYSHYANDDVGYEAFLIISTSTIKEQEIFLESINGRPDQEAFGEYLIILEFSNGTDLCRLRIEKDW